MKKWISILFAFVLVVPSVSSASNLVVKVKDAETRLPIKKATVTLVVFNEKEESWFQEWWSVQTQENGIALRLDLETFQKCVVRVEAPGYFSTFYGTPFYFYGAPKIVTIKSANTILEVYLQPLSEPPKPELLRTVNK